MTKDKVLEVLETYRIRFRELQIPQIRADHDVLLDPTQEGDRLIALAHCHGMLDEMVEFARASRMEKVFRWLGFVQGCFWSGGIYTINQEKSHNRPDPE